MRFTIGLPTLRSDGATEALTGDTIMEGAAAVEGMGYDACFVTDHPAPDAKWLGAGGHHALDPFVALSFAAAATTRLRVQTHILVLPYRNPLLTAKSIMSLDLLSQGRTIIGVASGYLKPEFAALGVDFDERNELTDEAIDVMKQVWEGNVVAYDGLHFRTRGTLMQPRPVQRPHPPLWIGGNSTAAIRRAVDRAQGWVPFPNPAAAARAVRTPMLGTFEAFAERMTLLREHPRHVGRTDPLDVCFSPFSIRTTPTGAVEYDPPEVIGELQRLEDLGVTWSVTSIQAEQSQREYLDGAQRFADEVMLPYRAD